MKISKKHIPNIITTIRVLLACLLPFAFMHNYIFIAFLIFLIASISDALDGYLARKWQVQSEYGQKLDPIADKMLSSFTLISLAITYNYLLFVTLLLEIVIVTTNITLYKMNKTFYVSISGKIKTISLFVMILINLINLIYNNMYIYIYISFILTTILQLLSIKGYISRYQKIILNKKNSIC